MRRLRLLPLLLLATAAGANDTAATLGAGGLIAVQSAEIAMVSEDLTISTRLITVSYVFRNTSSRDVDVLIAFPLPEMNGAAVANIPIDIPSRDPLNFLDFQIDVAGRKVEPKVEVRAFLEDQEITADLRALAIPLSALDGNVTAAVKKLDPAARQKIQKNNWVDCSLTPDGKCWPYWTSRIQYYWTQRFAAGATLRVRHSYRPVVGGGRLYPSSDGARNIEPYCGDAAALRVIRSRKPPSAAPDQPIWNERQIEYILTTANNWRGPIGSFHLTVQSDSSEDLVLTCMPGVQRTAPRRYELARTGFRPDRELRLLLLQPAK
jgi:hypothetical protein